MGIESFPDVSVSCFQRAIEQLGAEVDCQPDDMLWVSKGNSWQSVSVHNSMVSRASIHSACFALGIEPIDFYLKASEFSSTPQKSAVDPT